MKGESPGFSASYDVCTFVHVTHLQQQGVVALVLHGSNEERGKVVLGDHLMSPAHTQVLLKLLHLVESLHKATLLLKVDTESLVHWVELVAKLVRESKEIVIYLVTTVKVSILIANCTNCLHT